MDLSCRALLRLDGVDALPFLQKLVTQDLSANSAYTLLLTPQGRYLYDFFVVPSGDSVYLDVAAHQAEALTATLNKYKLRSAVTIAPVIGAALRFPDSRHPSLGERVWGESGCVLPPDYKIILTRAGIVEPSVEMTPNVDLPLEFGMQNAHAISFTKGCFLGQELTARTQHKHLIKHMIIVAECHESVAQAASVHDENGMVVGQVLRAASSLVLLQVKVRDVAYKTLRVSDVTLAPLSC